MTSWWCSFTDASKLQNMTPNYIMKGPSHEDFARKTSKAIVTKDFSLDKRMGWKVPRQSFSIDIEI